VLDERRRTITNKNTGETAHWDKYGYETGGKFATATATCQPGGGPPLHYHTSYAERFEAVQGELAVLLGEGDPIHLKPGETLDVPIGVQHRFSNDTQEDVTMRGWVLPAHPGFERSLYILFGLNNDGLADPATGMPHNILHTAVVADMGDTRFPGFKGGLLNRLTKVLAAYARWSGVEEELLKKYWD
jgi:mannose-6-phosphate isomerase-like protein (cupin superfamily)